MWISYIKYITYLNCHYVYLGKLAMTTLRLCRNTNATLGDNRYFYTWRTNDEPRNLSMYIHSSLRWEIVSRINLILRHCARMSYFSFLICRVPIRIIYIYFVFKMWIFFIKFFSIHKKREYTLFKRWIFISFSLNIIPFQ